MHRLVAVTVAVALAALGPASAAGSPLGDAIEARLAALDDGTTSVLVVDAVTGEEEVAIGADRLLNPASNLKLIATATALDRLGPDHVFTTRLIGVAPDPRGTVASDLYLLGSHDPTFDDRGVRDLVAQLRARGVRRIAGDLVVGRPPGRDGVARARLRVDVRAARVGRAPRVAVSPSTRLIVVDVLARTTRRSSALRLEDLRVTDDGGHPRLHLTVNGPIRAGTRWALHVAVPERALYTAGLLRATLRRAGVRVDGDVRTGSFADYVAEVAEGGREARPLAEHRSATVASLIARINKHSYNGLADRLVVAASAQGSADQATMTRAVDAMHDWLASHTSGLEMDGIVIDTGSGLSYSTRLSVRQLVATLAATLDVESFRASLSVAGRDGTLRHRLRSVRAVVRGKTGTLTGVVALSGVIEVGARPTLLFAIVTNGHAADGRRAVRRTHDEIVELLAAYARQHVHPR